MDKRSLWQAATGKLVVKGDKSRLISRIHRQMREWLPVETLRPIEARCLPWVIALLGHGALHSFERYLSFVDRLCCKSSGDRSATMELLRTPDRTHLSNFLKRMGLAAGIKASIRSRNVAIKTSNVFSLDFTPPNASDVVCGIRRLFHIHYHGQKGRPASLGESFAFYMLFLTLHPLSDGNGRIARFIFASDRIQFSEQLATHEILSLICLHRDNSRLFHMSAKCLRGGESDMLQACLSEVTPYAMRAFGTVIEQLADAIRSEVDANGLNSIAKRLHSTAYAEVSRGAVSFG